MRDVVAVEVDRTLVSPGQVKARRMTPQQRPIARIRGTRRRILGEERGETRTLREVRFSAGAHPGTGQHGSRHANGHANGHEWATHHRGLPLE